MPTLSPKRLARRFAVLVATGLVLAGVLLSAQAYNNNFHMVVDGQAYRSGQPTDADLRSYRKDYGIKTVINLRDDGASDDWRRAEAKTARELGIRYVEFPMSAGTLLPLDRARQLIGIMKDAEKPLLIHCRSGADRTGLAAAFYVAAIAGHEEDVAEAQLSVRYGHFGIPYFGPFEMDLTFEAMEPDFGFAGS